MTTRPRNLRPVVRRLSDGRVMTLDELAAEYGPTDPNTVTCTRCGTIRPRSPRAAAWFTVRWGCPACAERADLPVRPGAA